MDRITLGRVEITRVFETATLLLPRAMAFPDHGPQLWRDNQDWLVPEHWDPEPDVLRLVSQTWLLRSGGRTILVDTGVGNDKERTEFPQFGHWSTDYLRALGVEPEQVDLVVTTHAHSDHVGWNTVLRDGEWVPTFPNARYLLARADFDYWNPDNGRAVGNAEAFEDSIRPVHRAGQLVLWSGAHVIDGDLRLESVPGHTPGSAVLHLGSGTDRAVFVGDLLHSPAQLADPQCGPCFDSDPVMAAQARIRVLDQAVDRNTLVLPAHFGGAGAAEISRQGSGYAVKRWAPFG